MREHDNESIMKGTFEHTRFEITRYFFQKRINSFDFYPFSTGDECFDHR